MAIDPFDALLISTATIKRRAAAVSTANYGQPTSALPTEVATGVKCRVSKGTSTSWKYDKKVDQADVKIYMRVPTAWTLNEKDYIVVNGVTYNVLGIDDPSLLGHHLEIECETLVP